MVSESLKLFVKENFSLIENNEFQDLYVIASNNLTPNQVGELTEVLYLDLDINPLLHVKYVPPFYLSNARRIKKLTIPSNIIKISSEAFSSSCLETITIPKQVELVAGNAFSECERLQEVIFEPGCERIGPDCFSGCRHLSSVKLGTATKIGGGAFFNCTSLTYVKLPEGTTYIPAYCFQDAAITRLDIPKSVTGIGHDAFRGTQLEDVHYDGTVDEFLKIDIDNVRTGNRSLKEATVTCLDGEVKLND